MGVCGESEKSRKPKKGNEEGDENNITGIIEGGETQTHFRDNSKKSNNLKKSKLSADLNVTSPQIIENSKNNLLKNKKKDENNNDKKEKNTLDLSHNSEKDKNNSINDNPIEIINYDELNNDINYYIACPKCNNCQPFIENVEFDNEINDFSIKYICCCETSNDKYKEDYLSSLINPLKPENECPTHKENYLKLFCKNCKKIICELCGA